MTIRFIASRTYPYLNLTSGYNYNYNKFENGNLRSQQADGLNYGLSLGINLFDGFNQRRQKANARIEIENRDYEYRQVDQQVKADLITIFYAYQNNLLLFELEQQNLKTAEENLDIALERYKLGSLSGLELREVQKSLLEAEERLLPFNTRPNWQKFPCCRFPERLWNILDDRSNRSYPKIILNSKNSIPENSMVTGRVISHAIPMEATVFF